jgi:hypothetical protein
VLSTAAGDRDEDGQTVLDALAGDELVTVDEEQPRRADLALIVTGDPADAAGVDDEEWTDAERASMLVLALAADEASDGALVTGPTTSVTDDGMIAAVRSDADVSGAVSTVDVLDSPMGRLGVVLGLAEQARGGVGQYGAGADVSGVLPPVPAGGPSTTPTPGGDG